MKDRRHKQKQPHYFDRFREQLHSGKRSPSQVFRNLQIRGDRRELQVVAQMFENPKNPFYEYIYGKAFAHSWPEVRSTSFFAYTGNIQKELDWLTISILKYAREINQFIEQSAAFDKAFLSGSYGNCKTILDSIMHGLGPSLWVMEKQFLLRETVEGLEANKSFLSELSKETANDPILKFLGNYASTRAETKLSPENYRLMLSKGLNLDDRFAAIRSYFQYRLDHVGIDPTPNALNILYFEGPSPIVDRYLTFVAVNQALVLSPPLENRIAFNSIKALESCIPDPRIQHLLQFAEPGRRPPWNSLSSHILAVLDSYTVGDYAASAEKAEALLVANPLVQELYEIFIKSLVYLKKPFYQIFPERSLAGRILEASDRIIREQTSSRRDTDFLLKTALILWRTPFAYGLYDFFQQETQPSADAQMKKLMLLNASHGNPRFALVYDAPEGAHAYLNQLQSLAGNSETIKLMRNLTERFDPPNAPDLSQAIPQVRRSVYTATIYASGGSPAAAIPILSNLLDRIERDEFPGAQLIRDRVAKTLLACFLETGALAESVDMVVRLFIRNPAWIRRVSLHDLGAAIDRQSPPEVMRKITYPILTSLLHTKPRPVYVAYDNFLHSLGFTKPTQLFEIEANYNKREIYCFLSQVCTIEVLACSYYFDSTKALETERMRICQFLSEKDPNNAKLYSEEISALTLRSVIRRGMRQIEVSKIYVDEQGIRTAGRPILQESFARLKEMAALNSIEALQLVDVQSLRLYHLDENTGEVVSRPVTIQELKSSGEKVVNQSQFILFKDLFLDIRDRFISRTEYGLDAYLSVRIRHGVLQNQVRSPLESKHLLSQKDTATGEYLPNQYWEEHLLGVEDLARKQVQTHLSTFSKRLDDITQRLNKQMVQVKTERKNPEALFDYSFADTELWSLFLQTFHEISDFEAFLDAAFRALWERTDKNLQKIRNVISGEFESELYDAIGRLQTEIRPLVDPRQAHELLTAIANCQAELHYELDAIAQWFNISGPNLLPQFTLNELVSVSVESIKNIYPHKHIQPSTHISGEAMFDGRYFPPFYDIVRTLLDNAVMHAGLPPDKMGIEISAVIAAGTLTLEIKNYLSPSVFETDPVRVLNTTHLTSATSEIGEGMGREGGSGLLKVRKTMTTDLQRLDSSMTFSYDANKRFVVSVSMATEGLMI